ncbi:hypothetical protein MBLNU459_g5194t1 [Dothideomycetes sp. NU459]
MADPDFRHELITSLHTTLRELAAHPYPFVAGPDHIKKRASVALILRVNPNYSHWPAPDAQPASDVDSFFAQDWVRHGDAEIIFIKRAARKGDRWTGHIALPGGRRDPEDADDQAAAVREAAEEVGIHLSSHNSIAIGNLPQRVVTTSWGKVPLMVLCPYVFLLTRHDIPPLRLQPTEVASTHWVPLRALLSPEQRTVSYEDVSNRMANQETGVRRWMLRAMLGQMEFAAIRLLPSESVYCHASPAEQSGKSELAGFYNDPSMLRKILERNKPLPDEHNKPLLLWGLTLGIMADFLDLLPPYNALQLWTYPTFTPWDVRLAIWATTYKFKKRRMAILQSGQRMGPPAVEEGLDAISSPEQSGHCDVGIPGLGSGRNHRVSPLNKTIFESAIATLLEGYYDLVRKAVGVALVGRSAAVLLAIWLFLRRRLRQS